MAQPFGLIFELDETHSISFLSRKATKLGGDSEETVKTKALCHSRCGTIKIPPCSNASPEMVKSPYECNTFMFVVNRSYQFSCAELSFVSYKIRECDTGPRGLRSQSNLYDKEGVLENILYPYPLV